MAATGFRTALVLFCGALLAPAAEAVVTRSDIESWLAEPAPASLPAPGATLGADDLATLHSLIPPGSHQGKVSLRADGGMDGYVAGLPFDPERFDESTPEQAGMMLAWNQVHRWQYYGYKVDALDMIFVRGTPDGRAGTLAPGMEGGGHAERGLVQTYHRVYLNHLAMLPAQGY